MKLQRCEACGTSLYPPREICAVCLSDRLVWDDMPSAAGDVMAVTTLHHSHEAGFRAGLPLRIGLVKLQAGPVAVCFIGQCEPGARVRVTAAEDREGRTVLNATAVEG